MAYPDNKEDFTPVASPEFIRDNHINELQTLLETFQDIFGLFPNWGVGDPADIGYMFITKVQLQLTSIKPLAEGLFILIDKNDVLALSVKLGGNVGIKNNDPLVALDVTGNIQASEGVYEDRGDPAAYDFDEGDLTTDGTWRDLDLSGIVPAGAKTVQLFVIVIDDTVGRNFQFRKNGNSNEYNHTVARSYVANVASYCDMTVSCDTDRKIEYKASNVAWSGIGIVVRGWWR